MIDIDFFITALKSSWINVNSKATALDELVKAINGNDVVDSNIHFASFPNVYFGRKMHSSKLF